MTDKEKNEMIEKMISDPDWGIAQLKAVKARRENKKALIHKDQSRNPRENQPSKNRRNKRA